MPISNNLWPSIAPLKNRTADRSGSFREASPPMVSPAGWAKAESAPRESSATTADIDIATRRVKLAVASQVRIDKSSNKNVLRKKTRFGFVLRNQNRGQRAAVCFIQPPRAEGPVSGISEHASTARLGVLELGRVGVRAGFRPYDRGLKTREGRP